jgi:hypothetical protein
MATTPNYSFPTPDDTDLVKDGASAIRSLGTAIDTTVFTNAGAAIAKSLVDAKGDIIAATADNTVDRLAVGANDTILTADSSTATGLKWAAPAGGGKVLQVVNAQYGTEVLLLSSTFTDTGLTATITPSSATSKILVLVNHTGVYKAFDNATNSMGLQLLRGATSILEFEKKAGFTNTTLESAVGSVSTSYLDSPATTSATTYKTQFKNFFNGTNVRIQYADSISTITLLEIGA